MRPSGAIETAVAGHRQVLAATISLTESDVRAPSLLPHWTRARVIAHLAHKSRSHVAVFEGAAIGEVRQQYPEGQAAAEAETEAWSNGPAHELHELLADGFSALERAWERLPDEAWLRQGTSSAGDRSMVQFVERHLRDVFVHHVDLDLAYTAADWPAAFVDTELQKRLRDLPRRAEPNMILAWLLGRRPVPELAPW